MKYELRELVAATQQGDAQSAEKLLIILKPLILSYIKRYGRKDDDHEELLQEGYVKLLTLIYNYDESKGIPFLGYVKTWLRYFYLNYFRKMRNIYDPLEYEVKTGHKTFPVTEVLIDDSPTVLDQYIDKEDKRQLLKGLNELTPKQKEVIKLYYYKQLPFNEIAKKMGIHYMSVVKIKKRALDRLRKAMSST